MEIEQEKTTTGEERSRENPEEERAAETRKRNKTSADGNANRQLREEEKPQGRPEQRGTYTTKRRKEIGTEKGHPDKKRKE